MPEIVSDIVESLFAALSQEYQVIVDYPQQLQVLHSLMERGKLTENQCEMEKRNFVEYVRERCKKIPLLSSHCIVTGMKMNCCCIVVMRCHDGSFVPAIVTRAAVLMFPLE